MPSPAIPPLETFGPRICICGPSNGGKSTLAAALAKKLDVPAVHLDRLRHLPNTNWVQRPDAEFLALHDAAVMEPAWIIDGNYSDGSALRWQRATGIILLGTDRWSAFARYVWRTLFQPDRAGHLDGAQDSIKWEMVRWILWVQPPRREAYAQRLAATGLPFLRLHSMADLNRLYRTWRLER